MGPWDLGTFGRRRFLLAVAVCLAILPAGWPTALAAPGTLPARLTDQEFWRLVTDFSEPNGYFQSDNLVSNERQYQHVVPALEGRKGQGVYLGVAPDQNFTFIAALEPEMAFIVDIRRGNLHAHLLYKALFELSVDRAEFVSRLFSRPRPDGLGPMSGVQDILVAFDRVPADEALFEANLAAVEAHLAESHRFDLTAEDRRGIEYIYRTFASFGPNITYHSSGASGRARFRLGNMPTYAELQEATDGLGRRRSYLANEENFRFVKELQARNLIVPVVGDFAGPKALRSVGRYIADHGSTVAAFYVSNVEQYLFQNDVWRSFYGNVATLPLDDQSVFIRSISGVEVLDPIQKLLRDVREGRIHYYPDLRARIRRPGTP